MIHFKRFNLKRALDITFCLVCLPLFILIGLIVALAIVIDSPGSIFFKQTRIGKNGRPFQVIKFRTLKEGFSREENYDFMRSYIRGETDTAVSGSRAGFKPDLSSGITRIGRFLRKNSIDELPQIINVLKGEMSLVGPRPNVPIEVESYKPWHLKRLEVLPGITGLAQICGRSNLSFDRLVRFDLEYIENQSIILDLQILWRTFISIFKGDGAG